MDAVFNWARMLSPSAAIVNAGMHACRKVLNFELRCRSRGGVHFYVVGPVRANYVPQHSIVRRSGASCRLGGHYCTSRMNALPQSPAGPTGCNTNLRWPICLPAHRNYCWNNCNSTRVQRPSLARRSCCKRRTRIKVATRAVSAAGAAPESASPDDSGSYLQPAPQNWEATTLRLVDSSVLPFVFLLVPQVLLNTQNVLGGNASALAALSWVVSRQQSTCLIPSSPFNHLCLLCLMELGAVQTNSPTRNWLSTRAR